MAERKISRARRAPVTQRDLSIDGVGHRRGWLGLIAALLIAFTTLTPAPATAAETAITLAPATTTVESGVPTTFTMTVSCSTDGGCTNSTVTIPTTTITGTPAITDFGAWIGNSSCAGVTKTVTAGQVVFSYGTLPTGTKQCTFTVTAPEYKTLDNTVATITPTLASSNSTSSTATPVTFTATAGYNGSIGNSAPAQAITGSAFEYTISFACGLNGQYTGDIGLSALEIDYPLPANFEYQSYRVRNGLPGTFSYDATTRTLHYSDPTGASCGNPPLNISNNIVIYVSGRAASGDTPAPVGTRICSSTSASWTYIDGVVDSGTSTPVCTTVTRIATTVNKSTATATLGNLGQYTAPDTGAANPYTYAGNWDGSSATTYFDITAATVPAAVSAGIAYDITDPMPCLSNGANGNYTSNAPGVLCADPAFVPTLIVPTGFAVTTAHSITVTYTDGATGTIPYTASKGWIIPASPTVAEVNIPAFAAEGTNSAAIMRFRMHGYAVAAVPTPGVLTNRVTSTPYLAGDDSTPLVTPQTASSRLIVVAPPADDAALVYPGITVGQIGATCQANVSLNSSTNGAYSTRIEMPSAPSRAIYIDYLAPAGATAVDPATTPFAFTSFNSNGGSTFTSPPVTPTTTPNFDGTGRTLVRWTIPAGVVTTPGYYNIRSASFASVTLEAGCAGTYQNDVTVGYGAPIAQCYFNNYSSAHLEAAPMYPFANSDLRSNGSPLADNYCGYSAQLKIAAINPGFSVDKTVQGNLDPVPIGAGGTGHVSVDGGTAQYAVTFKNTGASTLSNPVMYDLLPRIGDTRASSTAARNSQFRVSLTDIDALPANLSVAYSTTPNPCRPEVLTTNPGCVDDWTTVAPASLGTVTALKFTYTGNVAVTDGFTATYSVSTPPAAAGNTAWNSIGTNVTAGDTLLGAAESSLTGLQAQSAQPAITKTADRDTVDAVGQPIEYTFTVTNNTAVSLSNVRVTDALVDSAPSSVAPTPTCSSLTTPTGTCSGASTNLLPGQSAIFTATYLTTQEDLDHGSISDQATASAEPPTGPSLSNGTGVVTVTAAQSGALTLTKTADRATVDAVGDVIDYTFTVTNSGNVTLHALSIDETAFSGSGSLSAITCPTTSLAPGASVECTATYPVTQADLTAGSVSNTATALATDPAGGEVTSPASSVTVDVEQLAALDLVKSATPAGAASYNEGQIITYSFVVTNTGNVPVNDIVVDEVDFSGSGTLSAIDCPADQLAPTEQFTCTATYTLTQSDIDSGSLSNTAHATGTAATGPVTSPDSTVTTPQVAASDLTLTKSADTAFVNAAGETVTYSFTIRNGGNVTVHDVAAEETAFTGSGDTPAATCPATTLAPGQQVVCTASYTVTQADMNQGSIENTARATAVDPGGADVVSPPSSVEIAVNTAPGLSVVKSSDVTGFDSVGEDIVFSFLVTNTGNVSLTSIDIDERAFTGSGSLGAITCPANELDPTETLTCTAEYETTQADIDRGSIVNTAAAFGSAGDDTVVSTASTVTVDAIQSAELTLEKTVTPDEADAVGDEVTYTFRVTNTGNVTADAVEITETAFSGTGALGVADCDSTTLAPGDGLTCTLLYRLTQADIDAGVVSNTAVATATAGGAEISSEPSSAEVTVDRKPDLSLVKSASVADPEHIVAGDVVTYSFVITNTGNTTITDAAVQEGVFTGTGVLGDILCDDADPLAPGDQLICSSTYTITQDDVDAGELSNTATATGNGPTGTASPTSEESTVELPAPAAPALSLVKSTQTTTVATAGQIVTYSFAITNTGNTTVYDVGVDEESFSGHGDDLNVACAAGTTLLPGQTATCSARYTVVSADLTGAPLVNTATATAEAPDGTPIVSDPSTARITDVATTKPPTAPGFGLAITGGTIAWSAAALALGLTVAGGVLLIVRRRRVQR